MGSSVARIFSFTNGPRDWQALLADPVKHWKTGYSARTLAHSWEAGTSFPPEVQRVFEQSGEPLLAKLEPLLAVPEFKVPLPGGTRSSQNDIFVLARSDSGPVSIMVEGKVRESFGPTLTEWMSDVSPGKRTRLKYLQEMIGLEKRPAGGVRYQLLHRAASAVITAEQFRAVAAVVLVHSFSEERVGFPDYQAFTRLFGVEAAVGQLQRLSRSSPVPLFGAWVVGDCSFLKS